MVLNRTVLIHEKVRTGAASLILLSSLRLVRLNGVASVPLNSLKFVGGVRGGSWQSWQLLASAYERCELCRRQRARCLRVYAPECLDD